MTRHNPLVGVTALGLCLLAGCATQRQLHVTAPLQLPPKPGTPEATRIGDAPSERIHQIQRTATPVLDIGPVVAGLDSDRDLPAMRGTPVNVNVQNLPVQVFANEVFGNMLGLTVSIDPQVSQLQELITLNTSQSLAPRELYLVARQVLADYGVAVTVEGKVIRVSMAPAGTSAIPPLVVSGRALPSVPISHRPVFQIVELEVVRSGDAQRWLSTIFGSELKVTDDANRNSLMISGKPAQVRQALEALRVFDRPLMRGRTSTRLEPAFLPAEQLADRMVEVLSLQGYGASRTVSSPASIIVLPVPAVNSVLVFASTQENLEYAVSWARELDRASPASGSQSMFYYQVRNTKAADLASVLNGGASAALTTMPSTSTPPVAATPAAGAPSQGVSRSAPVPSQLIVDEPRNALIFQGDPAQWERTLTLIRQMDRAPRQVMIEVTIAEVTLNDDDEFGVKWFAKNGFGRFNGRSFLGSVASAGAAASGFTYLVDVAGQNRFALTAFANDNRVSVLSSPTLLVKSGSEANIDVGTEVPTVTMQTTSNQQTEGNTNLLQSIQYRKTGIILKVKPTVYSDDRIDLDISQEVSEALPVDASAPGGSPSIFNRALNTSLTLRDGGSVVMAGLISRRLTDSDTGIPLIKDIPVVGNLFKNKSLKRSKTELVLMIVPYIIESDDRSVTVSQAIIDRFEYLDIPAATSAPLSVQPATPTKPAPAAAVPATR